MDSNIASGNISDASKPNAGRIYDYLLGGNHNFEIDRQAAEQLLKIVPHAKLLGRTTRWFLAEAVLRLSDKGYDKFIDFASGLPTEDHIHQITPPGTKVIYSDHDPVTVAYAQEIISGLADVRYINCDVRTPEKLINLGIVEELFGNERKVAIGLSGIAWFLPDEALKHTLEVLYNWAAPGSRIFMSEGDVDEKTKLIKDSQSFYKNMGEPIYQRTKNDIINLLGKWKLEDPGFLPLEDWIGMDEIKKRSKVENWTPVNLIGGFLVK